jgi:hypothetical protein
MYMNKETFKCLCFRINHELIEVACGLALPKAEKEMFPHVIQIAEKCP